MNTTPKISVIVPVYNAEKYLRRCIDSILSQTFTDFELLLIDDGSKDSSGAICDEYAAKDNRVRVFHKENGGVSSARNLGLDNATGEWIAFVDSDDYVLPSYLATYVEISSENVDLCIVGIIPDYSISSDYQITKTSVDYFGDVKGAMLLLNDCQMMGSLCNKLFRTSIITSHELRLDECCKFREDEDFFLKYMCYARNVSTTSIECYVYIIPDWAKYNNCDNFNVSLSMYSSVIRIFEKKANVVTEKYFNELINSYFHSFYIKKVNLLERTFFVKNISGKMILYCNRLSKVTRYIFYYLSPYLVSKFFYIKALLFKR